SPRSGSRRPVRNQEVEANLSARGNGIGLRRLITSSAVLAAAAWLSPVPMDAGGFRIFSARSAEWPSPGQSPKQFTLGRCCDRNLAADPPLDETLSLDLRFPDPIALDAAAQVGPPIPPTPFVALPGHPKRIPIGIASLGAIAGSYLNAY